MMKRTAKKSSKMDNLNELKLRLNLPKQKKLW